MATRRQTHTPIQTPDLSLSDSDDCYSSEDGEMPDREEMDRLLRQAHHYVITEGGRDSPSTYMERIQRINQSLIQEISMHSYDCDPKLYRRVKQKIDHVLREFEDAMDVDPSIYDCEQIPEVYTAAAEKVLYRRDSGPLTPNSPKRSSEDDVQRTYVYGAPDNYPEIWYKGAAASLPFPETIRMADWESLRVHWDLATTGDTGSKNPVPLKGVSFNDPRLEHHDHLGQYESGSKFRLPVNDATDTAVVNSFCTVAKLHKAVDAFSQHDDSRNVDGQYKYAPRVFLERFEVGQQANLADHTSHTSPETVRVEETSASLTTIVDNVREAVNKSPTKPREPSASDSRLPTSRSTGVGICDDRATTIPSPASSPVQPRTPVIKSTPHRVASAIRRIKDATAASIRSSPLPQSPPLPSGTYQSSSAKKSTNQTAVTGKRKRLSVAVEEETMPAKRVRSTKEPARPYTLTDASQYQTLHTPVVTPALTLGSVSASSVASTPPVTKARTAGKKQRRIRTKNDFEERVTPEKYAKIMAERQSRNLQDHEGLARGSTRSGKLRTM
ncbi:hypothetical protein OPT61_g4366 [Boeremia exigua]|uniref:Uncharacterized protein n=1 Tax=Boeremia exigua TaxID=749465 RepID=A0ACC2IED8_9PLEO|nr:hypothetical protein OPT61_g4366 [Boeremia exigua]